MEGFFMAIAQDPDMPGYDVFEKEAWGFKVCLPNTDSFRIRSRLYTLA